MLVQDSRGYTRIKGYIQLVSTRLTPRCTFTCEQNGSEFANGCEFSWGWNK